MTSTTDHQRRWAVWIVLAVMLLTTGHRQPPRAAPSVMPTRHSSKPTWQPCVWYQVGNGESTATWTLPFDQSQRYILVIGCLGDATKAHTVRLRSSADLPQRTAAIRRIEPLVVESAQISNTPKRVAPTDSLTPVAVTNELRQPPREFFLHVTDGHLSNPKHYASVQADCIGQGRRVQIFADRQLAPKTFSAERITDLLRLVECDVLPRVEQNIGPVRDVDGDGRFSIVLSPWLSRLQGGRTAIGGFVRSSDFRHDVQQPFSNRCDMLMLNSQLPTESALRDLLFHEITHAACISQRLSRDREKFLDEEDWLNEGMAHLAEPGWSNLDHRIAAFLETPSQFPLVVPDYYRAGLWRNHGCRGATFLFSRWCLEQFGPALPGRLANSSARGIQNLERTTARQFADMFRQWTLVVSTDSFKSLRLHEPIGRYCLFGAREEVWIVDSAERELSVKGTAFTIVELESNSRQNRVLHFDADQADSWQLSLLRVPHRLPASQSAPAVVVKVQL